MYIRTYKIASYDPEMPPDSVSEHLFFKIFLGGIPPDPPSISMLNMLIVIRTIRLSSSTTVDLPIISAPHFKLCSYAPEVMYSKMMDLTDHNNLPTFTLMKYASVIWPHTFDTM